MATVTEKERATFAAHLEKMMNPPAPEPPKPVDKVDEYYETVLKPLLKKAVDYCNKYREQNAGELPEGGGCCGNCKPIELPDGDYMAVAPFLRMMGMLDLCLDGKKDRKRRSR